MEGSALGVPRDEVGLGEQWELLLLLQELWVLEPAMRWTTGFWAKSTPGRRREVERSVSKKLMAICPTPQISSQQEEAQHGMGRLGDRSGGQVVTRICKGTAPGCVLVPAAGVLCLRKAKVPNGFDTFGGEKPLSLLCGG